MGDPSERDEGSIFPLEGHWREAIDQAATERELVALARDYVAQADVAALPDAWKLRTLRTARDVSLVTFRLAQAYCRPKLESRHERSMRPMLAFFQRLSQRLFAVRERAAQS